MLIVNFTHPLTKRDLETIKGMLKTDDLKHVKVPVHFNFTQPFQRQLGDLMTTLPLRPEHMRNAIVHLPGNSVIAGLLLAHWHDVCGQYPRILRMRPTISADPPRYEVAEVITIPDSKGVSNGAAR